MAKSKGSKVYAVARGRVPGIYSSLSRSKAQTTGYSGAIFKSFKTHCEAEAFVQAHNSSSKSSSVFSAASSAPIISSSNQDRKRPPENDALSNQRKKISNQQKQPPSSNFRLQITIHFDGGSRGNPGLAGAGAEVVQMGNYSNVTHATTTYSVREYCGDKETNNYAEYKGLLAGLKQAKKCIEQYSSKQSAQSSRSSLAQNPSFQLQIYGDSNLIIQQLRGAWKCRHPNIKPLFDQSQQLIGEMKGMGAKCEVLYDHVYREHNKIADALANEAMDQRRSWTTSAAHGSIDDSPNDNKKSAAAETKKTNPASSGQEVIDVYDSDNDSHPLFMLDRVGLN